MCSKGDQASSARAKAELAARLVATIDEVAAAATADADADGLDVAERLVRAWAVLTAADPELAARTARY
jgi:hypothetical protein